MPVSDVDGITPLADDGISLMSASPSDFSLTSHGVSLYYRYSGGSGGNYTSADITNEGVELTAAISPNRGRWVTVGHTFNFSTSNAHRTYGFGDFNKSIPYVEVVYPVSGSSGDLLYIDIDAKVMLSYGFSENKGSTSTLSAGWSAGTSLTPVSYTVGGTSYSMTSNSVSRVLKLTSNITNVTLRYNYPYWDAGLYVIPGFDYTTSYSSSQFCQARYVVDGYFSFTVNPYDSVLDEIKALLGSILNALSSSGGGNDAVVTAVNNASTNISNTVQNVNNTITNIFESTAEQIKEATAKTDAINQKADDIKTASEEIAKGTPTIDAPELAKTSDPMQWVDRADPVYTAGNDLMASVFKSSFIKTMLLMALGMYLISYVLHGKKA